MFMEEYYTNVSKRLQVYRNLLDLTQKQMGEKFGVGQSHYCKLEAGLKNVSYDNLRCFEQHGGDIYYLITGQRVKSGKMETYLSRCRTHQGRKQLFQFLIPITQMGLALILEQDIQLTERTFKSARFIKEYDIRLTTWENIRKAESCSQLKMAEYFDINIKRYRNIEKEKTKPNAEILHTLYHKLKYSPLLVLDQKMYYADEMNRAWELFSKEISNGLETIVETILKFVQDHETKAIKKQERKNAKS